MKSTWLAINIIEGHLLLSVFFFMIKERLLSSSLGISEDREATDPGKALRGQNLLPLASCFVYWRGAGDILKIPVMANPPKFACSPGISTLQRTQHGSRKDLCSQCTYRLL